MALRVFGGTCFCGGSGSLARVTPLLLGAVFVARYESAAEWLPTQRQAGRLAFSPPGRCRVARASSSTSSPAVKDGGV